MASLILCFDGSGMHDEIAELVNEYYLSLPVAPFYEPVSPATVLEWFAPPHYDPRLFSAVISENGRVWSYSWAWSGGGLDPFEAGVVLVVRPSLPPAVAVRVSEALLSWARHSLVSWQGIRGGATVYSTLGTGPLPRLLVKLLGGGHPTLAWGYVLSMEPAGSEPKGKPSGGLLVRSASPHRDDWDLQAIAALLSESARSRLAGYLDVQELREYYERLLSRKGAFTALAISGSGEPIGFVEAYTHESLTGSIVGRVNSLMVSKRVKKGVEVGLEMLAYAVSRLVDQGARIVYVDSTENEVDLFLRAGFRLIAAYGGLRVNLDMLPLDSLDGAEPWNPRVCPV